mmetsp:Transcript_16898/g.16150  ORF Transcript_16898/g.16150 Transcript_16898/m.16150 type:complete len:177 (+) Transcript_16898:1232-1762(+)
MRPFLNPYYEDGSALVNQHMNFFEDLEDGKTRASTFSQKSNREELFKLENQQCFDAYAFIQNNGANFQGLMIRPIDTNEEQQKPISPGIPKQQNAKSPHVFNSPVILDFLDDDNYFNLEEEKQKSKTEFVRRDRQDSEDSGGDELPGVTSEYLNSIISNNSFKFAKSTKSRFSFRS